MTCESFCKNITQVHPTTVWFISFIPVHRTCLDWITRAVPTQPKNKSPKAFNDIHSSLLRALSARPMHQHTWPEPNLCACEWKSCAFTDRPTDRPHTTKATDRPTARLGGWWTVIFEQKFQTPMAGVLYHGSSWRKLFWREMGQTRKIYSGDPGTVVPIDAAGKTRTIVEHGFGIRADRLKKFIFQNFPLTFCSTTGTRVEAICSTAWAILLFGEFFSSTENGSATQVALQRLAGKREKPLDPGSDRVRS